MRKCLGLAVAFVFLPLAGAATAQSAPVDPVPFTSGAMGTADLSAITGREDTAQSIRAENAGTVSHNSVIGQSQTGDISFDANSFQALAGLSLLSANTGNNVSINSSLNVNVSLQPR